MTKQISILEDKIRELKKKRNAVILAHNYQLPEVQDVADYRGDSLELSRAAARTEAKVIVFCGVYFMAETASILSPQKTVIMPDTNAGCPMANMLSADQLRKLKQEHPGAVVVGY
ncbi:MAG: quinolinate synthase NadA, partial [Candidatus Omnitrophota bacterium]